MVEGEVGATQRRGVEFSIRRLAEEFGMARETVAKRIADGNVRPSGQRGGFPVYRLRDVCPVILFASMVEDGRIDPDRLRPMDRNAWYQSELRRMEGEMRAGRLVPTAEHEADAADLVKSLVQFLETLPDQLERDIALTPEQVDAMHSAIDVARQGYYERLISEAAA